MPIIPPELIREIITNVEAEDRPSLLDCLLVSQNFKYEARRVLYKFVALDAIGHKFNYFRHTIDANPQNALFVLRIAFSRARCPFLYQPAMYYILSKLPNLRMLEISRSNWSWEIFMIYPSPSVRYPWKLTTLVWDMETCPSALIAAHQSTLGHIELGCVTHRDMVTWGGMTGDGITELAFDDIAIPDD
ncbi:hypothetical protein BDN71DRAFT_1457487 [Pleurotus eryngii]|uniref:F-box domain-containing protein n=1 Tax=Pleurotus eryngii TaxID=5323 RepID=A0A9P6DA56_PLEER|nr:hypothetical protein BDN71DRAFT_1457487 [Pleurotus eryngii]